MNRAELENLLLAAFPEGQVAVTTADGVHFAAHIVNSRFSGCTRLVRHQMVYAALGERMGREVHALSVQALTPAEATEGA